MEGSDDLATFYILLLTLPLLIFTNFTYPYPDDSDDKRAALVNAFSMLDLIDMAELMFGDIGCFQTYEFSLKFFFFVSLLMSALLTVFFYGLEQQSFNGAKKTKGDGVVTFFNLVFNDILFLILRCVTIDKEGHAYFGVIFIIKEAASCMIRTAMLYYHLKGGD